MFAGHLPLWNPYILSGIPLVGDAVSNPFDPLNILFIFLNPVNAYEVMISLQLFLAGLFMFLYLRKSLNLNSLSALLGGVLYILNPMLIFVQRLDFINSLGSFMWLPVIVLFLERAMESKSYSSRSYAILMGMALSFSFFCGGVNFSFLMAPFLALHIFLSPGRFIKKMVVLIAVGLIAIFISSVQLLPVMETANQGHRKFLWGNGIFDKSGTDLPALLISLLNFPVDVFNGRPDVIVKFLNSNFNIDVKVFYMGLIEFFLLSIIYLSKAQTYKERIFKINLIAFLIFLVSIYYLPLKGALDFILPVFKGVHLGYSIFLFYFCAIVLMSISFNRLVNHGYASPFFEKYGFIFKTAIFSLSLLMGTLFMTRYSPVLNGLIADPWNIVDMLRLFGLALYLVTLCLSAFVIHRLIKSKTRDGLLTGIILFLSIISNVMVVWEIDYFSCYLRSNLQRNFTESKETNFFRKMKPYDRFEIYHGNKEYWTLNTYGFDFPLVYSASISGGSQQLMSARYRKFYDMLNMRYPFNKSYYWKDGRYVWPSAYAYIDNPNINKTSLNLLGVKYLLYRNQSNDKSLELIQRGDYFHIYENLDVLPRCFIMHKASITTPENILAKLSANSFDPLQEVLFEKVPQSDNIIHESATTDKSKAGRCEIIQYTPNEIVIKYSSLAHGFLVLTDAYDKDWTAYIDGKETEILQSDYLFRAVSIPAGEHTIRFKYLPISFVIGAILSISTLIISFALLFHWRRKIHILQL